VGLILKFWTSGGLPITELLPGQEFVLHVLARDNSMFPRGVFAAFLDVSWDSALAVTTGHIRYNGTYANGRSGSTSIPGLIGEGGAFASTTELGSRAYEVFSVPMRATATGTLMFTSNPADQLPIHEVLVFGLDEPVRRGKNPVWHGRGHGWRLLVARYQPRWQHCTFGRVDGH
jgi:hypothetical protein